MMDTRGPRWLATGQGILYVVTGSWPAVHMDSFLAVTGPKRDLWLVSSFGLLIAAFGAGLLYCVVSCQVSRAVAVLALAVAGALVWIDVYYVATSAISPVYLLDGAAEALIACGWLVALWSARRHGRQRQR